MQKLKPLIIGVVILLVAGWAAVGTLIWSRNSVPALSLRPRAPMPAGNVYDEYTQLVKSVKDANVMFESMVYKRQPSPDKKQNILKANETILASLRDLAGRPSVVTALEPGAEFVAARDFPNVAQLAIWKSNTQPPAAALDTLIDGLYFAEGSGRNGAFLQLTTAFTCYVPLFMALDGLVAKVPPVDCARAADRVKSLIESQGSLPESVNNELRARIRQLTSTFPDPMRGFKLKFLSDDYAWDYVMKPKAPALQAVDRYLAEWASQAKNPFLAIKPPAKPEDKDGVLADEALAPDNVLKVLLRHYYKDARLRALHAGLRARAANRPPALQPLVAAELLTDPFTGAPLTYTRTAVYSVGPDGQDSGGTLLSDDQLQPNSAGDLVVRLLP